MAPDKEVREYLKSFLLSAVAGALFGLVAAIVLNWMGLAPAPGGGFFIAAVTLLAGLFSGLAGFAGACLDDYLRRRGMEKALTRLAVSFGVVALLTAALAWMGFTLFGVASSGLEMQRIAAGGIIAGLIFGALFALGNYLLWRNRQKMILLEMENRHLAELTSREELLREAARNLAVTEERNRMARELHDTISQGMHGIVYSLRSLHNLLDSSERGMEILSHLEQTAEETLQELSRLVAELSPSPLEDQGLVEALRRHCSLFARRHELDLDLRLNYKGGLQTGQEEAIYRIVQEALANALRHSAARRISLELAYDRDGVTLMVSDDGSGFDLASAPRGRGLANMEARARQSGGSFTIISGPGAGTEIKVRFPQS